MTKNIFIRLLFLLFICLLSNNVFAVRATTEMLIEMQSDGTELHYFFRGDEHFHFLETTDGYELTENKSGDLVYINSTMLAHNPDNRSVAEKSFLAGISKTEIKAMRRTKRAEKPRRTIQAERAAREAIWGEISIPVLLVEFADKNFDIANPRKVYNDKFNKAGYSDDGHNGSVRDYFLDNSLEKFDVHFDVIAPVKVSKNYAYYGTNNSDGNDQYSGKLVTEALQLASAGGFDFSQYDFDNDKYIDYLVVIYAGLSESDRAGSDLLWPHSWSLRKAAQEEKFINPVVNGVRGDWYLVSSELMGRTGTKQAGIGTICHEFCHLTLGLHDLYDVDYNESGGTNPGFGSWSLMDTGNKLNNERTPPYLTAFERESLGWGTVTVLEQEDIYSLNHIKTGEIYRINTDKDYEYFLLENRQQTGWDKYLPGHGMLITRVYADNPKLFNNNTINNIKGEERVNLLEANGAYYYGGYLSTASDAFPGTANITTFDDVIREPIKFNNLPGRFETPANSRLWSENTLKKTINNIREKSGIVLFSYLDDCEDECGTEYPKAEAPFYFSRAGNILTITSTISIENISVYNLQGQLLQQKAGEGRNNTLILSAKNIYLIKLDGKTRKIVM